MGIVVSLINWNKTLQSIDDEREYVNLEYDEKEIATKKIFYKDSQVVKTEEI